MTVEDDGQGGAEVTVEGETFHVEQVGGSPARVATSTAAPAMAATVATPASPAPAAGAAVSGPGAITAPIPGVITTVLVKVGDAVSAGQIVLKLEAMKMENDISSHCEGVVKEIAVEDGAEVKDGQLLVVVE